MYLLSRWRALWNPDMYHGWGRTRRYFEGWYFKLVNAEESAAYAVIPGISMAGNGTSHAFIQVMDGKAHSSRYYRFETAEFRPDRNRFALQLGGNFFSSERITIDLPELFGTVRFELPTPWPKMLGAPGIMGWYSFVPFMECFHGVVSLQHRLEGALTDGSKTVDFTGGKGYTEKDWGRSFPRAYVWMQTNHFTGADRASLMASVAHIPWINGHFTGFICGFWLDGRLFRFATYTGARPQLHIDGERLFLSFKSPKTELHIQARQAPGAALSSPVSGEMTGKINESLEAVISATLWENGTRIFDGTAHTAGLEVAGAVDVLKF